MSPILIILCICLYFGGLLFIAYITSRNSTADSYFLGNKASPWYAVAFGMIGDSLSGVTYISVPGKIGASHFSYLQLVLGYFVGYFIISKVLLPIYYKMNLISIYTYLETRFGKHTQKAGAFFFILSRILGASGRLFPVSYTHLDVYKRQVHRRKHIDSGCPQHVSGTVCVYETVSCS